MHKDSLVGRHVPILVRRNKGLNYYESSGVRKKWYMREVENPDCHHCTTAATTKSTKTMALQESSMDLVGQVKGEVEKDSSFGVSVTRKMASSTGKMVLFQDRGMGALVLDILSLR